MFLCSGMENLKHVWNKWNTVLGMWGAATINQNKTGTERVRTRGHLSALNEIKNFRHCFAFFHLKSWFMAPTKQNQSLGSVFSLSPNCPHGYLVYFGIFTICFTTKLNVLVIFYGSEENHHWGVWFRSFLLLMLTKKLQNLKFLPQMELCSMA